MNKELRQELAVFTLIVAICFLLYVIFEGCAWLPTPVDDPSSLGKDGEGPAPPGRPPLPPGWVADTLTNTWVYVGFPGDSLNP